MHESQDNESDKEEGGDEKQGTLRHTIGDAGSNTGSVIKGSDACILALNVWGINRENLRS